MDDEDTHRKTAGHQVGEDLTALSIEELGERIDLLKGEIERLQNDIKAKRGSADSAAAFFK